MTIRNIAGSFSAVTGKTSVALGEQTSAAPSLPEETLELPAAVSFESTADTQMQQVFDRLSEMQSEVNSISSQLKAIQSSNDAQADEMRIRMMCLIIASRIMMGDRVPPKDHQFLAEHNMELYKTAITMRVANDNPKKHKALSADEESLASKQIRESGASRSAEMQAQAEAAVSKEVEVEI